MGTVRLTPLMSAGSVHAAMALVLFALASPSFAQTSVRGETYAINRAKGSITIDGNLSDEGWRDALRIERWYEIEPGDNIEPPVKSVGFVTYDSCLQKRWVDTRWGPCLRWVNVCY